MQGGYGVNGKGRIKRNAAAWIVLLFTALLFFSCSDGLHTAYERQPNENQVNTEETGEPASTSETSNTAVSTNSKDAQNTAQDTASAAESAAPDTTTAANSTTAGNTEAAKQSAASTSAASAARVTSPKTVPQPSTPTGKYLVGYYAGWSGSSGYTPDKIKAAELTHLNYAFAKIGSDLKIALIDPASDVRNFACLRQLKAANPSLRTLISVGGWADSAYFSDAALTSSSRGAFAQSCLDFIQKYGFDGVDLDWEYPVSGGMAGNKYRPEDKQNFTYLLQAIRNKLNEQSQKDGKTYSLTIAGGASSSYISRIEVQKVAKLVDYIFIMGYDMHGPWDTYSDFNAPLYAPAESSPQYKIGDYDSVSAYTNAGVFPSKLVLGMPFYGRQYTVTNSANNGLYSTYTAVKSISYDTIAANFLSNPAYKLFSHPTAEVPYLYGNNVFISFDNPQSIAAKVKFAQYRRLAGAGAWELSQDRNGVLLESAYAALYS